MEMVTGMDWSRILDGWVWTGWWKKEKKVGRKSRKMKLMKRGVKVEEVIPGDRIQS